MNDRCDACRPKIDTFRKSAGRIKKKLGIAGMNIPLKDTEMRIQFLFEDYIKLSEAKLQHKVRALEHDSYYPSHAAYIIGIVKGFIEHNRVVRKYAVNTHINKSLNF